MNLPIPTPAQVEEFRQIYLEEFGKELTPNEAWEAATTTLQLFYLGTYGQKTKAPPLAPTPSAPCAVEVNEESIRHKA